LVEPHAQPLTTAAGKEPRAGAAIRPRPNRRRGAAEQCAHRNRPGAVGRTKGAKPNDEKTQKRRAGPEAGETIQFSRPAKPGWRGKYEGKSVANGLVLTLAFAALCARIAAVRPALLLFSSVRRTVRQLENTLCESIPDICWRRGYRLRLWRIRPAPRQTIQINRNRCRPKWCEPGKRGRRSRLDQVRRDQIGTGRVSSNGRREGGETTAFVLAEWKPGRSDQAAATAAGI